MLAAMPPTPPPRPPERFVCPICGCEAYEKVWVTGRNGRPVISDIHRVGDEGRDSLREEMATIIKGEQ